MAATYYFVPHILYVTLTMLVVTYFDHLHLLAINFFGGTEMTETKVQPEVVVFSTPTCSYCSMAKNYIREKGIKFR
jgi:hypothetical protein